MKIKRLENGYGEVVNKKGKTVMRGSWGQCVIWLGQLKRS